MRLALVICGVALGAPAHADPPAANTFRSFGSAEGLENISINQVAQTDDGLLWIATEDGLYRHDGAQFQRLDIRDGLPSNQIFALLPRPRGLWVGTAGGLATIEAGHVEVVGSAHGLPEADVNALATAPDGSLWAATDLGLFHQVGDRFALAPGWPGGASFAVWLGGEGRVTAGRGKNLVIMSPAGTWIEHGEAAGFGRDRIDAIVQTGDGTLWVRSALHLWSCERDTACRDVSSELPDVSEIGRLMVDHAGSLWVTTRLGLAHHLGAGRWERIGTAEGLPTSSVTTMFEDREGSLWLAADQLYQLLGRGLWRSYTTQNGFPANIAWTIMRGAHGALRVGSNRGVLEAVGDRWTTFPGTEPYTVQTIVEVGDALYAAGTESRVMHLDTVTRAITMIGPPPELESDGIPSMVYAHGTLWVATSNGGLLRMTEEAGHRVWRREVLPGGDQREDISQLLLDRHGRLWAAGSRGLAVRDGAGWRRFTERDGLAARSTAYVVERASGELCVAYAESHGVTCFLDAGGLTQVHHLTQATGLTSDKIYLLGEDHAGRLYAGLGIGIDVIDGATIEHFSSSSGLVGDDCAARAFWVDPDGVVLIGTTRGLARFSSAGYVGPPSPIAPVVTSISLGGAAARAGESPRAPTPGTASLMVRFGIPTFANRSRVEWQIRLRPLEADWRRSDVTEARYAQLPHGDYVVEMRTRLAPGGYGPITKVAFTILPAWWQTRWFRALVALGLLTAIAGAIIWRVRVMTGRASRKIVARSEASFRALIEQSPDAVFVHRDGVVVYANARTAVYLGADDADELIGYSWLALVHPDEHASELERARVLMATGQASSVREIVMVRPDASWFTVEVSALKVEFDGSPATLAIARDCTERKALEARVMHSDRMASIGTLAAGIAHEINNPLSYVLANLELIAEDVADSGSLRDLVADALEGATRVRHIVKGLKTFSRVRGEPCQMIDIQRALDLALRMTSSEVRHRCKIVKNYGPVPPVFGDESRLGQVFVNLLVNAAQAIPAVHAEDHEICISTRIDAGAAVIEIRDTGCGMTADVSKRVFEPFFTTKDIGEGTGLGLSICHGIVRALGGTIAVESAPGAGSTFRITLPGTGATVALTPPHVVVALRSTCKILVIDDDDRLRLSIGRMLCDVHAVTLASSSSEALAQLDAGTRFDVILCDLMMPGCTGMALHEQLVGCLPDQARRMLFMTGGASTAEARAFIDRMSARLIEKPFAPDELRRQIQNMVGPVDESVACAEVLSSQ